MNEREIPQYLYHYTSLDKLALILKNRTFRLNPLTKMDDLQEQKTADVKNIGQFVFVSSWTSDDKESIPMWKMYTSPLSGVRIKLKSNPFSHQGTAGIDFVKILGLKPYDDKTATTRIDSFLNIAEMLKYNLYSPQAWNGEILFPVEYTDDKALLEPIIGFRSSNGLKINIDTLGKYKNTGWEFQQEWRYILHFYKMSFDFLSKHMDELKRDAVQTICNLFNGTEAAPIEYYDLPIDPHCFSEMEITASPQLSAGNRIILEALLKQYNPTASLRDSDYQGLL